MIKAFAFDLFGTLVRQWDLKVGDELAWSWEVRKGEMTLIVNKATNKK
jgi:hypothetical protein